MKFSASILVAVVVAACTNAPHRAAAFTVSQRGVIDSTALAWRSHRIAHTRSSSCACPDCARRHFASCECPDCVRRPFAGFLPLSMSTVEEGVDVPVEVEAMDGVASDVEAHNVERPARGSGIGKHAKDGDKQARTDLSDLVIGSEVLAKVKTITTYGAFLDIGARSDALVHVSRLSDGFVANVGDILKQGDEVSVRIISVDPEKNQIAVTMRSAEADEIRSHRAGGCAAQQ